MSTVLHVEEEIDSADRETSIPSSHEAMGSEVFAVDRELNYLLFNEAHEVRMMEVCGSRPARGGVCVDLIEDITSRTAFFTALHRALGGETQVTNAWWKCNRGPSRLLETQYSPIRDPDGRPVGVTVTRRDATPESQRNAAYVALETRYHTLLHAAADGILVLRRDGQVLECNEAAARILGRSLDEVGVGNWRDWSAPGRREDAGTRLQSAFSHPCEFETALRRGDGKLVAVEITAAPVTLEGRPAVIFTMRDITDRWASAQAVAKSEAQLRTIFENAPIGIGVMDLNTGRIIEANNALLSMYGRPLAELTSAPLHEFTHPDDQEVDRKGYAAIAAGTLRDYTIRKRYLQPDGTSVPIEIQVVRLPDALGQPPLVLGIATDLRQLAEAENAVRSSEARLRFLFDNAPIGIGLADLSTGGIVQANPALLAIYGRTAEELESLKPTEFTHPDDREEDGKLLPELQSGRVVNRVRRKRYIQPDGTVVPVELHVTCIPTPPGSPPLALVMVVDLRQISVAEDARRQTEEKYRRLVDNAQDIVYRYRTGADPAIEYINPSVERLLGTTPQEFYADPQLLLTRIDADYGARLRDLLESSEDLSVPVILKWRHANGDVRWLEHRGNRLFDAQGEQIAVEGIARDVTATTIRDERLRLLGRAVEQAAEVVIISDREGRIQHVNRAFETVTGYSREEVIGANPRILKSGVQGPEFYARMWNTLNAGETFSASVENRKKDGSLYDAELVVSPVRDQTGTVTHYVGLQRDVTKERARAEQLRQAQKMEAMGQVTGGIAHDFNNLLTVVLANANLLGQRFAPAGEEAECLRDLTDAALHGSTLVRQLLAFGRKELLAPGPIDLHRTVGEFMTVLRRVLPETVELPPLQGTTQFAFADGGAVEQMLLNLATNARDAMPTGGTLQIEIGSQARPWTGSDGPASRYTTLTVRDTGSGMTAETKRRAFEPFYTTKPPGKGTGLGLPMVFGTMEQLGGWIEVESELGIGTTFTLGFSAASGTSDQPVLASPLPATPAPTPKTVLLVEDNPSLLRISRRVLEKFGCRVLTGVDGEEGFAIWSANRGAIELVMTDAVMPKCGGPDLIRRIRKAGGTCRIILGSGYASEDFSDLERDVTLLPKPWTNAELIAAVGGAPAQHRA